MRLFSYLLFSNILCSSFVLKPQFTKSNIHTNENRGHESRSIHMVLKSKNNTEIMEDFEKDIIEEYSNWFGMFPPTQKWKSVRFTIYAIVAGHSLAEFMQYIGEIHKKMMLSF